MLKDGISPVNTKNDILYAVTLQKIWKYWMTCTNRIGFTDG